MFETLFLFVMERLVFVCGSCVTLRINIALRVLSFLLIHPSSMSQMFAQNALEYSDVLLFPLSPKYFLNV
jgi:hypothetical protein